MKKGTTGLSPEKLALLVELLPTVQSFRDAAAILGVSLQTVRHAAAPFLAIMKLEGSHPQCGCGRDRFHPYGCADSYRKGAPQDCLPGHSRSKTDELLQRRKHATAMLIAGDRFCQIDDALGMSRGSAKNYLRFLSQDQLSERSVAREKRAASNPRMETSS